MDTSRNIVYIPSMSEQRGSTIGDLGGILRHGVNPVFWQVELVEFSHVQSRGGTGIVVTVYG
jgi:hypothetical protein